MHKLSSEKIAFGLFWFPLLEALQTNNMTLTLTAAVETSLFSAKIFQRLLIHILTYPSDDVFHLLHPKKKKSTRELHARNCTHKFRFAAHKKKPPGSRGGGWEFKSLKMDAVIYFVVPLPRKQ